MGNEKTEKLNIEDNIEEAKSQNNPFAQEELNESQETQESANEEECEDAKAREKEQIKNDEN